MLPFYFYCLYIMFIIFHNTFSYITPDLNCDNSYVFSCNIYLHTCKYIKCPEERVQLISVSVLNRHAMNNVRSLTKCCPTNMLTSSMAKSTYAYRYLHANKLLKRKRIQTLCPVQFLKYQFNLINSI